MSAKSTDDIENRFAYHKPNEKKVFLHQQIRDQVKTLAHYWDGNLPVGREQALALTKLEEAMFWANAAIARSSEE